MTSATRVRIDIPDELLQHFEAAALLKGVEIEEYILAHLARTHEHSDENGIYLSGVEAQAVRRMLGSQVGTKKGLLVEILKKLVSWRVGGWNIELPLSVQEQIYWYAKSSGRPIDEIAPQLVLDAIREKFRV